jgi:hypothetical protein
MSTSLAQSMTLIAANSTMSISANDVYDDDFIDDVDRRGAVYTRNPSPKVIIDIAAALP